MKPTRRVVSRLQARKAPLRPTRRLAPRLRARGALLRGPKRPMPTGQKKTRRLKVRKFPTGSRGPPPSCRQLLQEAIMVLKESGKAATLSQLRQQLQRKRYRGRFDEASNDLLHTALQRLAERGEVICKEGCKYRYNLPTVSESADPPTSTSTSFVASSRSGASPTSGSTVPTDFGATSARSGDSHTSASTSAFSDTDCSDKSPRDEASKDAHLENVDGEDKRSTGESLSSSGASASSTASRASSKRR